MALPPPTPDSPVWLPLLPLCLPVIPHCVPPFHLVPQLCGSALSSLPRTWCASFSRHPPIPLVGTQALTAETSPTFPSAPSNVNPSRVAGTKLPNSLEHGADLSSKRFILLSEALQCFWVRQSATPHASRSQATLHTVVWPFSVSTSVKWPPHATNVRPCYPWSPPCQLQTLAIFFPRGQRQPLSSL